MVAGAEDGAAAGGIMIGPAAGPVMIGPVAGIAIRVTAGSMAGMSSRKMRRSPRTPRPSWKTSASIRIWAGILVPTFSFKFQIL